MHPHELFPLYLIILKLYIFLQIRLNRKEARLKRKNNKPADHANQEHKSFDLSSDDQKLHFVKW